MTPCPKCGRAVPVTKFACPGCIDDASRPHIMRTQVEPLRAAEAGTAMLTIRLVSGRRHIQLFGFDYTFCSQHVTPQARRSRIAFNDERELERVCVACRWHMRQALA